MVATIGTLPMTQENPLNDSALESFEVYGSSSDSDSLEMEESNDMENGTQLDNNDDSFMDQMNI